MPKLSCRRYAQQSKNYQLQNIFYSHILLCDSESILIV